MKTERSVASALLLTSSIALASCGLKGDLYLPGPAIDETGASIEQPTDTIVNEATDEAVGSDAEDGLEEQVE